MANKKEEETIIKVNPEHKNYMFFSWDKDGNIDQKIDISGLEAQMQALEIVAQVNYQVLEKAKKMTDVIIHSVRQCKDEEQAENFVQSLKILLK